MAKQVQNSQRRADAVYLIAMTVVILAFLAPAWRQPESIWMAPGASYSDLTISHWPNWWLVADALRQHGAIPLWRPAIMGGAPLVGNPLSALFYPPNWLLVALPLNPAFHVLLGLHMVGAGAALYGLARRAAGRTPFAAFVGGLSYALTPKLVAHVGAGHVGLWQAYAWLPLSLWLLHSATRPESSPQSTRHRALGCGAVLALTYLADPRVAFFSALSLAAYGLYRWVGAWRGRGPQAALRQALWLTLAPLSALAFSAVQALPTLELMRALTRSTLSLSEAGFRSLPWRYVLGYLLMDWGGYHEWMTYLGLVPLGLGVYALCRSRARARWFWLGLAALSLLYALGVHAPFYPLLYRLLPALGWVRVPSRALLLVILSASVLATHGADALLAAPTASTPATESSQFASRRSLAKLLSFGGLVASAGLGLGFAWLYPGAVPPAVFLLAGAGTAGSLAWFLSLQPRVPRPLVQAMLVGTLIADLGAAGHSLLELRPAETVMQKGLAAATYVKAQAASIAGPSRVYSPSFSIPQHTGARLGLEQVDGIDPSQLRWAANYIGLASGCMASGYGVTLPYLPHSADPSTACRDAVPDTQLLGLLNACLLVAKFPIRTPGLAFKGQAAGNYYYRNQHCLPRAFVMARTEPVANWQAAHERLAKGHDLAKSALVEDDQTLNGASGWHPATIAERSPNHLIVHAETTQPALLVLGEVWYPGWHATVDGIERPIVRVNGIVRGVYLDPGAHTIVWRFRPASLRWGAAVTLCALAGLLAALLPARWRRRGPAP